MTTLIHTAHQHDMTPGEILTLPSASVRILGHLEIIRERGARPIRLPRTNWSKFPPNSEILRSIICNASGVRLLMRTCASVIRLTVRCTRVDIGTFIGPVNSFVVEMEGQTVAQVPAPVDEVEHIELNGASSSLESVRNSSILEMGSLPEGEKDVIIWLPQGMIVDILDVAANAAIKPGVPARRPLWIHHGSSISHCASPKMPTSSWPVVTASISDLELVNLGFGGNCMLDPFTAEAIARTPADVITLKVGVNIVGGRTLDCRSLVPALHGFLDRIRQGHPKIPIVVASSILWPGSEDRPGPGDVEFLDEGKFRCFTAGNVDDVDKGALTMANSREHIAQAIAVRRAEGDNIAYFDGLALYGPQDLSTFVMSDSLHPEADLYEEIGRRFARIVFGSQGLVPRSKITGVYGAVPDLTAAE